MYMLKSSKEEGISGQSAVMNLPATQDMSYIPVQKIPHAAGSTR